MISPDKTPDLPNFAETFARQSSWEWNFGRRLPFRICWTNALRGGVELHFDVERSYHPHAGVYGQP